MLWFNVGVACLIFLSVNATSHWVSVFYGEPRLIGIAALLSTTFLFNGVTAQFMAVLQRHLKIRRLVLADVLSTFVGLVAAIFAALGGLGYWALAIQPVVSQAISLVVVVMVSSWRPGLPRWSKGLRGLVGAGTGYAGFNLLNFISRNLDDVLIGKLLGPAILGYYNRAYNLMLLPLSQITGPLAQIMVPLLSRQIGSPDLYRTTFLGALEKLLFLLSPFIMTNVVGADWLVKILLGDKWGPAAAIYSALVLQLSRSLWGILPVGCLSARVVRVTCSGGGCLAAASQRHLSSWAFIGVYSVWHGLMQWSVSCFHQRFGFGLDAGGPLRLRIWPACHSPLWRSAD